MAVAAVGVAVAVAVVAVVAVAVLVAQSGALTVTRIGGPDRDATREPHLASDVPRPRTPRTS